MVFDYERDVTDSWYAWEFFFPVVLKVKTDSWYTWGLLLPVALKVYVIPVSGVGVSFDPRKGPRGLRGYFLTAPQPDVPGREGRSGIGDVMDMTMPVSKFARNTSQRRTSRITRAPSLWTRFRSS